MSGDNPDDEELRQVKSSVYAGFRLSVIEIATRLRPNKENKQTNSGLPAVNVGSPVFRFVYIFAFQ